MKSPKELTLEQRLVRLTTEVVELDPAKDDLPLRIVQAIISDDEIQAMQDYANSVSIVRLGFNDHGPVHMRTVGCNAMKMLKILHKSGIKTSLESEGVGSFSDSVTAVVIASLLHDLGMTVGRQDHEIFSAILANNIIDRLLNNALTEKKDLQRKVIIRSLALEGILGHMGSRTIHSLEAGIVQIADGCDMTKGRARIPIEISKGAMMGDIHKYSANSIEKVMIGEGDVKPVKITVHMSEGVGFFQVEEVLLQKISRSPAKGLIELYAGVEGQPLKQYL